MQTMSLEEGAFVWSKESGTTLYILRTEDGLIKVVAQDIEVVIEPAHQAFKSCMIHTESSVTPVKEES